MMVKILVPTDYSSCSIAALKHAISLARGSAGELLILHVDELGPALSATGINESLEPLHREVTALLASLSKEEPPLRYEERRMVGVPVVSILKTATEEQVDLIVMGTTGRTGLPRIVMGSIAEQVCRRASCPVLTLKAQHRLDVLAGTPLLDSLAAQAVPRSADSANDVLSAEEINDSPALALLSRAIASRVTDIHIDPTDVDFVVRFRIDGRLINYCHLSSEIGRALITQLKVLAGLDIADPFHAQEGRLKVPESLKEFEVRLTYVPVIDGEAMSLRLLSRTRLVRPLAHLGLSAAAQQSIEQVLRHGEGLVLVTGPTGSGKTTTLYSMLHALDDGARNIVSIEDPVEFDIPTFRQLSVDLKHGMTMTSGLRTLLRLDPDVVLVGEIRDSEAADTVMRAASSGKYVFSSLHTRDVASTVTALRDLRVDNRSLAGNLAGIISQRLLRRLCPDCNRPAAPTEHERAIFLENGMQPPAEVRHPVGCQRCRGTGYYDRIGVFEVVTSDLAIMNAIEEGNSEDQLRCLIHSHGVSSLKLDALQKVADGILSLEECEAMTEIRIGRRSNEIRTDLTVESDVAQEGATASLTCALN